MCGCCESKKPIDDKSKYQEKDKGIVLTHQHMLIYSNFYWKNSEGKSFTCCRCNKIITNYGSFYCKKCNYIICTDCFDILNGEIFNEYFVNQVGTLDSHKHILTYLDVNSRNIPITKYPHFTCKICDSNFLMEEANSWNCARCGIDICEKCFKDNGGRVIH